MIVMEQPLCGRITVMYLAIKSDQSQAEIYLVKETGEVIASKLWQANRTLARDLLGEIDSLISGDFSKLTGVIVFRGPGSFTGLRIGITSANAIAYGNNIPIVGSDGPSWLNDGVSKLNEHENDKMVIPVYGALPHITKPTK